MPEVTITDRQQDRLAAVRDDLAEVFVGEYGSIREQDAIEYLLDTYSPAVPEDSGVVHRRNKFRLMRVMNLYRLMAQSG